MAAFAPWHLTAPTDVATPPAHPAEPCELLWSAVASSADGVALLDPDGVCLRANDVLAQMLGRADGDALVPASWRTVYDAGEQSRLADAVRPALERDGRWRGDATACRLDGTAVTHALSVTRLADGTLLCVARAIAAEPPSVAGRSDDVWYRVLFEDNPRPAWIYDVESLRFLAVNPAATAQYGWTAEQFARMTLADVYPTRDRVALGGWLRQADDGPRRVAERRHVTRDGRTRLVELGSHPLVYAGCAARLVLVDDVTDRRELEAAMRDGESRFRGVLEHLRAIAVCLDLEGRVTFINDYALQLTGRARDEVVGHEWFAGFFPDPAAAAARYGAAMAEAIMGGAAASSTYEESELLARGGAARLVAWDILALRDGMGRVTGAAAVGRDVTEQRRAERTLRELSTHDELTGILNRRGFRQMVTHEAKVVARTRRHDALLYLDLDRFKPINDTYGHAEGDKALRAVTSILQSTVRDADFLGRLGGDEFAVYAVGLVAPGQGTVLAARLRTALAAHNATATAAGRPYEVGFSIGVADVVPGDELDATLARADAELYAVKAAR